MSIKGTGASIAFTFLAPNNGLSLVGRYRQIGGLQESVDVLDDTALSSTGYTEKLPGDLIDAAGIACEIFSDPDSPPPLGKPATIVITFQPPVGKTNGARLSFSGFISERNSGDLAPNQIVAGSYTVVPDGKTTKPTFTPSS